MREYLHILKQCITDWLHGFGTKRGNEPYLLKQAKKENARAKKGAQNYEI